MPSGQGNLRKKLYFPALQAMGDRLRLDICWVSAGYPAQKTLSLGCFSVPDPYYEARHDYTK